MKELYPFCTTDRQRQLLDALMQAKGNRKKAAEIVGITERRVYATLQRLKSNAAKRGAIPNHTPEDGAAPGYHLQGTSTLYDEDGNPKLTWVKTSKDRANPEEWLEFLESATENYKGLGGRVKSPKGCAKDLLVVYPMGDPHLGMYAWADETGDDFDLEIATSNLTEAVSRLVDVAPPAETAIILNLGDFFHSDDSTNSTKRSGNVLDVDTRWGRVYLEGYRAMIQCIDAAREKHKKVIVKNLIGNHDDHTSQTLAVSLYAYFHKDPRVEIDIKPAKFWYHQFGKVLIGGGHGDTAKPDLLPQIMAADVPEMWGQTKHRYFYTGHIHSQNQKEFAGVIWESFKTLAGKDAWHSAKGYRSGRDMFCIAHHVDHGEIERHRVDVGMLGK